MKGHELTESEMISKACGLCIQCAAPSAHELCSVRCAAERAYRIEYSKRATGAYELGAKARVKLEKAIRKAEKIIVRKKRGGWE